jgi:hypothetical protein
MRPTLLEFTGPLFASFPFVSNLQYRLSEVDGGTLILFRHTGLVFVPEDQKSRDEQGLGLDARPRSQPRRGWPITAHIAINESQVKRSPCVQCANNCSVDYRQRQLYERTCGNRNQEVRREERHRQSSRAPTLSEPSRKRTEQEKSPKTQIKGEIKMSTSMIEKPQRV